MLCSVVITSYRRPHLISRAVRSALAFCAALGEGEVVVVDDGSFDDSMVILQRTFPEALAQGTLRLTCHWKNKGVTAAKNTGFLAAQGQWVCFLDSDDELLPENAKAFPEAVKCYPNCPLFFFKCITPDGAWVGTPYKEAAIMDIHGYFANAKKYAEVLTVIRRDIDLPMPYDDDLRGFEGLGCLRILRRHGPGIIDPHALRRYYVDHNDRLSSRRALLRRSFSLARGHARTLVSFWRDIDMSLRFRLIVKVVCYFGFGIVGLVFHKR